MNVRYGRTYFDLERTRAAEHQYRENSARLAQAHLTYQTEGTGQLTLPEPLDLGIAFVEQPAVSYGADVVAIPDPTWWQQPRATGGVARWVRDAKGFYVGVWCYFSVDVPPQPLDPAATSSELLAYRAELADNPPRATVVHHLMFRAEAYKRLPAHVDEMLEN